ncbi:uncharacterized protein LOC105836695 [Monomorium pharaonis]|uniref:uncharacterized protein LOC105836695 n=1 Tax=Monomorium pharaonis TaxID=307658 RepID=UPI00063ED83B|nr:uncharacterized protein LOC105836695 [Monomorium pharaonis]
MSGKHEPSLNMTERCRICLVDHGCMTSLQNERLENKLKDLTKCTCIDVKYEENLPGVVCHVCLYKLNMWSEFKEQFVQSNKILLEQLEISETSDNTIKDSSRNESCTTKSAERKRKNGDDNVSDIEKKKSRIHGSSKVVNTTCDTNQVMSDVICILDDDNLNIPKDAKNEEYMDGKTYSGPMRVRLLPARRGRNIERRKASTKRWVERKKALIAATGENVSDTDSIASDDVQLSPVQKARAKTNAMDKDVERQKKISRVLKNLETNLTEKYTGFLDKDTDSDTRRTRSINKELIASPLSNKNSLLSQVGKRNITKKTEFCLDSSMENERSSLVMDGTRKSDDQPFTPRSLKSELIVGDITYAVTSTLVLVDPSNLNENVNSLTKESHKNLDESNRENTDIIDAVQLRRINPMTPIMNSKPNGKFVERCLNIEVEGSELEVLKRVQSELAIFVEREMKQKLFGTSNSVAKTAKTDNVKTNSVTYLHQKLDQKLKDIVEIAIKKNIDASVGKKNDACGQTSTNFSLMSAKSAINSPRYQPKVLLKRLDITKESKHYNINNAHVLTSPNRKLAEPFSVITRHKRQSIPPVRYGDFNTSTLYSDSDDTLDEDDEFDEKPKAKNSTRQSTISGNKSLGKKQDGQKANSEEINKVEGAVTENHICGVCGLTFHSRKDVETHVRTHKITSGVMQIVLQNENTVMPLMKTQQNKQKMMRCKRCHEIVEARLVKAHVCKTSLHKCYVCNSMFRTKNLLAKHLESHDSSEFNLVNAIGNKKLNNTDAKVIKVLPMSQKNQVQGTETTIKTLSGVTEKNDIQSDKITSTGVKLDSTENILKKPKETYTCFVCDKIFTDEEILKDHLQKHCDDLSEGEQSNNKEQYQCAICSKTLESDQALEEHVGKHLFDDEDDNPNLISIGQGSENNDKSRETIETYQCGQCSETFDSEVLLEMHMQAHEEEVAIAEWEKQGMKVYQYQCMLCEELFNTEEELTQHLDIHNANPHVCQLCDKPFRTLEDLQEHVATH